MDEAAKDKPQVRRIGRPPKAKPDISAAIEAHRDNIEQAMLAQTIFDSDFAQYLAKRIWDGQSPDLPRAERLARVKAGVEAQGLSMEGVTL